MRSIRWVVLVLIAVAFDNCIDKGPEYDVAATIEADIATIDSYIATNSISGVIVDKSGIRFRIEKIGTGGFPPKATETVKVAYKGMLLNGTVFDQKDEATNTVSGFIVGWQYLLMAWPPGTKGTVYIPSPLGYGNQPVGPVPPNSVLIFDIELKSVTVSNADKARLASDVVKIDEYLAANSIDAVKDTTGVRYVITNPGTGPLPSWHTKLKFTYTGKIIPGGAGVFNGSAEPSDSFDSRVVDFLHGMQAGLTKIGKGGKITLFVPSGLAYGTEVNGTPVPPNSNLQLDVEMLDVF
jgi:FKBP-type peptidyl-prolyl cis-trans isomerase